MRTYLEQIVESYCSASLHPLDDLLDVTRHGRLGRMIALALATSIALS
jgi:hypothetical protein